MDVYIGQEVGYSIRFEKNTSKKTILKFSTDGVMLRKAIRDKAFSNFSLIILDEAHERSIATDILITLLKKTIFEQSGLKLMIMSATIDTTELGRYFGDAPITVIPGRNFLVSIKYLTKPARDYVRIAVFKAAYIHCFEPSGNILIFLTGEDEIIDACNHIEKKISKIRQEGDDILPVKILPLYSSLSYEMQKKALEPVLDKINNFTHIRKIIVSTNIAEASITIERIVYVIDSGLSKQKFYNPTLDKHSLIKSPISQDAVEQRSGRAGRTQQGICYRLYTEESYHKLVKYSSPEMTRFKSISKSDITSLVLQLTRMGYNDLVHFDYPSPPSPESLIIAYNKLHYLGAIDNEGHLTGKSFNHLIIIQINNIF